MRVARQHNPGSAIDAAVQIEARSASIEAGSANHNIVDLQSAPPEEQAIAWNRLAELARARGDWQGAVDSYIQSASINPLDGEVFFNLGTLLYQAGHLEPALSAMRTADLLAPDNTSVLANLGRILLDHGDDVKAETVLRRALELAPDEPVILKSLANLLRDRGNSNDARTLWEKLLALRPGDAEAHFNLTMAPGYRPAEDHVDTLRHLLRNATAVDDRAFLGFALFRTLELCGHHEDAFAALTAANREKRASFQFNLSVENRVFAHLKRHFTAEPMQATGLAKGDGPTPVFIVGMPRSGTSLAEQILASHPDVHGAGERGEMVDLVGHYLANPAQPGLLLDQFHAGSRQAEHMAKAYLDALRPVIGGKSCFTDKMPLNFRWVGIIRTMFPNARIVHCTRSPIANCLSIYASLFASEGNRFAYDLDELADYYVLYADLMAHWHDVLGDDLLQFDLDGLKHDQEGETRRLLDFCRLGWDDRCLAFHKTERIVRTLSAGKVHQGLDVSVDRRTVRFAAGLEPLARRLERAGIDPQNHWKRNA